MYLIVDLLLQPGFYSKIEDYDYQTSQHRGGGGLAGTPPILVNSILTSVRTLGREFARAGSAGLFLRLRPKAQPPQIPKTVDPRFVKEP